ncbi:MAG: M20/M25/M40 family metallo-hydrolase [Anaerolineales bacterium]|nr:M20/M25/M40 family metallo-hydrolase [Anaerolineales bacterium]
MSDLLTRFLELAIQIQQVPAPTFQETERAAFVRMLFEKENLADIHTDAVGNVYARLPGQGKTAPLVVSAHTDTVFPASTPLNVTRTPDKITGPGIGDNSLAVASLFALLWSLREAKRALPGDLWLVTNTGEEGLGDLIGMRAVVDRFGAQPLAYVVLEGMSFGKVYHRALGVRRYRISATTEGGHSWGSYGKPSAIHELAAFITRLTALPIPEKPRTSLNVGIIQGGTSINTIAPNASLELDLRSENPKALATLIEQVQTLVEQANRPNVQFTAEIIGDRPAGEISPSHPLVQLALDCIQEQDYTPQLNIGSTDANIPLSRGLPAVCIGLTTGHGAHTIGEYIDLPPLEQGLAQLVMFVQRVFSELA